MASASRQCHGDKKPRADAAGGMNYVADQPVTASSLGGIYSQSSDRSYLKPECYEFSPTDKKTKRSSRASQARRRQKAFISGMSWPQIWPQTTVISTELEGGGGQFLPLPPPPPPPLHPCDSLHYLVAPLLSPPLFIFPLKRVIISSPSSSLSPARRAHEG